MSALLDNLGFAMALGIGSFVVVFAASFALAWANDIAESWQDARIRDAGRRKP